VPEVSSRLSTLWRDLEPRRGLLFLTNIGLPILVGVIRGEVSGALIGGTTGLLLSIADTEGSLGGRLCLTLMVAGGIVTGALLGLWLKAVPPTFWLCFFIGVFAAGLLNQLGKGPHFALRFGAISLGVVASLPAIVPQEYVYFAYIVLLCLLSRSVDHLINGPLGFSGPWLGNATFDRFGWFRFALAYALSATMGLWIGIEAGSIRAIWTSAITLVLMVPDVGMTYRRVFGGVAGTVFAICVVWLFDKHQPCAGLAVRGDPACGLRAAVSGHALLGLQRHDRHHRAARLGPGKRRSQASAGFTRRAYGRHGHRGRPRPDFHRSSFPARDLGASFYEIGEAGLRWRHRRSCAKPSTRRGLSRLSPKRIRGAP
jgi:hypothetical protein